MRPAVTLVVRKRSTGYRIVALAVDSLDHAWTIANVLARSAEYSRCMVVATGWDGSELWTLGMLAPACPAPPPAPYAAPPPPYGYSPALPPGPAYAEPYPRPAPWPGEVIEAEPVEPFAPPPALPPRRW